MQKILSSILFFSILLNGFNLDIQVTQIDSKKNGDIILNIFNKYTDEFPNDPTYTKVFPANKKTISYTLRNLSKGEYAVYVIHDENKNSILDESFFGLFSDEGYGYSNNYRSFPSFRKSQINLNSDTNVKIKLIY